MFKALINMLKALLLVLAMWITRKHHTDDYDIMADDYEKAKELELI